MARALAGKTAIITGAGRGIGQAVAVKLAAAGACVVVNDLDAEPAADTLGLIGEDARAVTVVGSVTEGDVPQRLVDTAISQFGSLDIIVNNAGYVWDAVIQRMSDEQWHAILDVHLTAPFRILRAAQPLLSKQAKTDRAGGDRVMRKVVNIASTSAVSGNAGQVNYSAAKAGLIGLTRTLAREWGRYNVNVNAVAFGVIETRLSEPSFEHRQTIAVGDKDVAIGVNETIEHVEAFVPLGRRGTPEEAAGSVYFFCSPESDYVSGQMLVCGGGWEG